MKKNLQTQCPILGGNIDKSVFADHDGKRIYFCCPACETPFKKDADKHIAAMEAKGVQLEKVSREI